MREIANTYFHRNKSKIFSAGILLLALFMFFSCADREPEGAGKSAAVSISAGDRLLAQGTVDLGDGGKNALDAFRELADSKGIEMEDSGGFVTKIGDFQSTETEGWCFYINGAAAQVGAAEYTLLEGDEVYFAYVNWKDSYPELYH